MLLTMRGERKANRFSLDFPKENKVWNREYLAQTAQPYHGLEKSQENRREFPDFSCFRDFCDLCTRLPQPAENFFE